MKLKSSLLTLTLALATAASGCAKQASAGDCDALAAHILDLAAKRTITPEEAEALKSMPALTEMMKTVGTKQADIFKTRCKTDGWRKESTECMISAPTQEAASACKLTEDQAKTFHVDMVTMVAEQSKLQGEIMTKATEDAAAAAAAATGSALEAAGSAVEAAGAAATGSADEGAADEAGSGSDE